MQDQLDPEIANLLEDYSEKNESINQSPQKESNTLTRVENMKNISDLSDSSINDISRKQIDVPVKMEEEKPATWFSDPDYYKKVMVGEGEEAKRVHMILAKFLQANNPEDKSAYRLNLATAYWGFAYKTAQRLIDEDIPLAKRLMLRYGVLHPGLFTSELKEVLHRIIFKKSTSEPIYYLDEWLHEIVLGRIKPSSSEEIKYEKRDDRTRYSELLAKVDGRKENAETIMRSKASERKNLEVALKANVEAISQHLFVSNCQNVEMPYTDQQKKIIGEWSDMIKRMMALNKDLETALKDFDNAYTDMVHAKEKLDAIGEKECVDIAALQQEFGTIKNMAKLCVGRQGNHFPLLAKEYFHGGLNNIATRENIAKCMAWLETIDIEVYYRQYKAITNRIVPFVILLPCYGDNGICWESFDIHNRASSRGRVAIPMYPKNLQMAIVVAMGDLRWTTAKDKASYLWMEEGLSGHYYQHKLSKKFKGDIKEAFISDYINWIMKESQGIQKLEREIRNMFWRYIPFSQETKEKLKIRSSVYAELCQKDTLRDG